MQPSTDTKIVLVTRPTRLADLVARFNTIAQARFYLEHLGADFGDYLAEDDHYRQALAHTRRVIQTLGRLQIVSRPFLPNFLFGPEDIVVVLGQDGLVANTLKYLQSQPVVAVNPDPPRHNGRLLPFTLDHLHKVLPEVLRHRRPIRRITMAKATLNTGLTVHAVNDLFLGRRTHASAHYDIAVGTHRETQLSSGIIVSTGLGSTGWFRSLTTGAFALSNLVAPVMSPSPGRDTPHPLPAPRPRDSSFPWDADHLFFTVREPFPTPHTQANLVFGRITRDLNLIVVSGMPEDGVVFSDGLEQDYVEFNAGTRAVIEVSDRVGSLVT